MHKKTLAPLASWPRPHYLSKPKEEGGLGVSHTRTGPAPRPPWSDQGSKLFSYLSPIFEFPQKYEHFKYRHMG